MPNELHHELEALQRDWALRILLLPLRLADDAHDNALRALVRHLDVPADWPKPEPLKSVRESLAKSGFTAAPDFSFPEPLWKNLRLVEQHLRATPAARDLLGFAVLLKTCPFLRELGQLMPIAWETEVDEALAMLLGHETSEITAALEQGPFLKTGLLSAGGNGLARLSNRVSTDDLLAKRMLVAAECVSQLADDLVSSAADSRIQRADFSYLPGELAMAKAYLRDALLAKRTGTNILLIGSEGVGKTAFARSVAESLGRRLIRPVCSSVPSQRRDRAARWMAAQSLYAGSDDCIFLFDELEDMSYALKSYSDPWWRTIPLESAPVPTIWEGREVVNLERAFVERFDLVLRIDTPRGEARRQLLTRLTRGLPAESFIERWMETNPLNVKALCRTIEAARAALRDDPELDGERAFDAALTGTYCAAFAFDGRLYS